MDRATYCVRRVTARDGESIIARRIDTLAEAAEVALRLLTLQEVELGGSAAFFAEAE